MLSQSWMAEWVDRDLVPPSHKMSRISARDKRRLPRLQYRADLDIRTYPSIAIQKQRPRKCRSVDLRSRIEADDSPGE